MQSEEGKDLTTKRGKNDLPFNMDEIQGPHLEGETAKKAIMLCRWSENINRWGLAAHILDSDE